MDKHGSDALADAKQGLYFDDIVLSNRTLGGVQPIKPPPVSAARNHASLVVRMKTTRVPKWGQGQQLWQAVR